MAGMVTVFTNLSTFSATGSAPKTKTVVHTVPVPPDRERNPTSVGRDGTPMSPGYVTYDRVGRIPLGTSRFYTLVPI